MYRPTIRLHDVFKDWVEDWFQVTHLDRNQLIRLAMIHGADSKKFLQVVTPLLQEGCSPPSLKWRGTETWLWESHTGETVGGERLNDGGTSGNRMGISQHGEDRQERKETRRLGKVHGDDRSRQSIRPYERKTQTIIIGHTTNDSGVIRVSFD